MFDNIIDDHLDRVNCDYCCQRSDQWMIICGECHLSRSTSDSSSEMSVNEYPQAFSDGYPLVSKVNYLLLGTYLFHCQRLELYIDGLCLPYVSSDVLSTSPTYDLQIGLEDIYRLLFFAQYGQNLLFIELKLAVNMLVNRALNLSDKSGKGLKFDVSSDDLVERYLVIDLDETAMDWQLIPRLIASVEQNNKRTVCQMTLSNVVRYIGQNYRKYMSCIASN